MYLEIQLSRAPVFAPRVDASLHIVPNSTLDEREETTPWRFFIYATFIATFDAFDHLSSAPVE